jgi:Ca-activated chloride channel family protein
MEASREPISVHIVIDRSSSMQSRWSAVLRAAASAIASLAPNDRVQIVVYDNDAEEILPLSAFGDGSAALDTLASIPVGGGTNMEAGLRMAYGSVRGGSGPHLVILLSDGVPTAGAFDAEAFARIAGGAAARGCVTSAVGLGSEFDAALLATIAREGGGGYHISYEGSDVGGVLAAEIQLQRASAGGAVTVDLDLAPGVTLVDVHGAQVQGETASGFEGSFAAPRAGEDKRLVLKLAVAPGERTGTLGRVRVRYGAVMGEASLDVAFGGSARSTGGSVGLAVVDADLASTLENLAGAILGGGDAAAAASLDAHVARARARVEWSGNTSLRHRTGAVARLAVALPTILGHASYGDRRRLSHAVGELAVRFR